MSTRRNSAKRQLVLNNVQVQKKKRQQMTIESFWSPLASIRISPPIATLMLGHDILPAGAEVLLQTPKTVVWCIRDFDSKHSYKDFVHLPLVSRPEVQLRAGKKGNANRDAAMYFLRDLQALETNEDTSDLALKSHIYKDVLIRPSKDNTQQEIDSMKATCSVGNACKSLVDYDFNGTYANRYRDGNDCIGSHFDKEVRPGELVISVAYGATRIFRLRQKPSKKIVMDIEQKSGMLICMTGWCQVEFKHEVPVQKKVLTPRISLTFRRHARLLPTYNDNQGE